MMSVPMFTRPLENMLTSFFTATSRLLNGNSMLPKAHSKLWWWWWLMVVVVDGGGGGGGGDGGGGS